MITKCSASKAFEILYCMPLMETDFAYEISSEAHSVKRFVFMLSHVNYLTTTRRGKQSVPQ